jgi:small multidrug resistance pump
MRNRIFTGVAILSEVVATSALKSSEGFTRAGPTLLVMAGYGLAFHFLSLTLRTIPVGVACAIWAGLGVVFIALVSWMVFDQKLDAPAVIGMGLILSGVILMNLISNTPVH